MLLDTDELDLLDLSETEQLALLTDTEPVDLAVDGDDDPPQTADWTPEGGFVA